MINKWEQNKIEIDALITELEKRPMIDQQMLKNIKEKFEDWDKTKGRDDNLGRQIHSSLILLNQKVHPN